MMVDICNCKVISLILNLFIMECILLNVMKDVIVVEVNAMKKKMRMR